MKQRVNLPRRVRWAVPAGAVAVAGGVLAGSVIPAAQAAPLLPSRTPAQLLAALAAKTSAPPLTGTVVETASLGLPALPSAGDPASLPSLLAGSHTIRVWFSDPAHFRLAVPQTMTESDVIRNGSSAWLWDSSTNAVTHIALPPGAPVPRVPSMPLTPQQAAGQVLARVGPTTAVSVDSNVTVAGEAAYQLVLAPKSSRSLVGQVRIAIDARNNVPLRVQVFARGAQSPAIQVGFTSVSFVRPAPANFAFRPPAGAKVTQESAGSGSQASGHAARGTSMTNGMTVIGQGWLAVAAAPQSSLVVADRHRRPGRLGSRAVPRLQRIGCPRIRRPGRRTRRFRQPGPQRRHRRDLRRRAAVRSAGQRTLGQRAPAADQPAVGPDHQPGPDPDRRGHAGGPLPRRHAAGPRTSGPITSRGRPR